MGSTWVPLYLVVTTLFSCNSISAARVYSSDQEHIVSTSVSADFSVCKLHVSSVLRSFSLQDTTLKDKFDHYKYICKSASCKELFIASLADSFELQPDKDAAWAGRLVSKLLCGHLEDSDKSQTRDPEVYYDDALADSGDLGQRIQVLSRRRVLSAAQPAVSGVAAVFGTLCGVLIIFLAAYAFVPRFRQAVTDALLRLGQRMFGKDGLAAEESGFKSLTEAAQEQEKVKASPRAEPRARGGMDPTPLSAPLAPRGAAYGGEQEEHSERTPPGRASAEELPYSVTKPAVREVELLKRAAPEREPSYAEAEEKAVKNKEGVVKREEFSRNDGFVAVSEKKNALTVNSSPMAREGVMAAPAVLSLVRFGGDADAAPEKQPVKVKERLSSHDTKDLKEYISTEIYPSLAEYREMERQQRVPETRPARTTSVASRAELVCEAGVNEGAWLEQGSKVDTGVESLSASSQDATLIKANKCLVEESESESAAEEEDVPPETPPRSVGTHEPESAPAQPHVDEPVPAAPESMSELSCSSMSSVNGRSDGGSVSTGALSSESSHAQVVPVSPWMNNMNANSPPAALAIDRASPLVGANRAKRVAPDQDLGLPLKLTTSGSPVPPGGSVSALVHGILHPSQSDQPDTDGVHGDVPVGGAMVHNALYEITEVNDKAVKQADVVKEQSKEEKIVEVLVPTGDVAVNSNGNGNDDDDDPSLSPEGSGDKNNAMLCSRINDQEVIPVVAAAVGKVDIYTTEFEDVTLVALSQAAVAFARPSAPYGAADQSAAVASGGITGVVDVKRDVVTDSVDPSSGLEGLAASISAALQMLNQAAPASSPALYPSTGIHSVLPSDQVVPDYQIPESPSLNQGAETSLGGVANFVEADLSVVLPSPASLSHGTPESVRETHGRVELAGPSDLKADGPNDIPPPPYDAGFGASSVFFPETTAPPHNESASECELLLLSTGSSSLLSLPLSELDSHPPGVDVAQGVADTSAPLESHFAVASALLLVSAAKPSFGEDEPSPTQRDGDEHDLDPSAYQALSPDLAHIDSGASVTLAVQATARYGYEAAAVAFHAAGVAADAALSAVAAANETNKYAIEETTEGQDVNHAVLKDSEAVAALVGTTNAAPWGAEPPDSGSSERQKAEIVSEAVSPEAYPFVMHVSDALLPYTAVVAARTSSETGASVALSEPAVPPSLRGEPSNLSDTFSTFLPIPAADMSAAASGRPSAVPNPGHEADLSSAAAEPSSTPPELPGSPEESLSPSPEGQGQGKRQADDGASALNDDRGVGEQPTAGEAEGATDVAVRENPAVGVGPVTPTRSRGPKSLVIENEMVELEAGEGQVTPRYMAGRSQLEANTPVHLEERVETSNDLADLMHPEADRQSLAFSSEGVSQREAEDRVPISPQFQLLRPSTRPPNESSSDATDAVTPSAASTSGPYALGFVALAPGGTGLALAPSSELLRGANAKTGIAGSSHFMSFPVDFEPHVSLSKGVTRVDEPGNAIPPIDALSTARDGTSFDALGFLGRKTVSEKALDAVASLLTTPLADGVPSGGVSGPALVASVAGAIAGAIGSLDIELQNSEPSPTADVSSSSVSTGSTWPRDAPSPDAFEITPESSDRSGVFCDSTTGFQLALSSPPRPSSSTLPDVPLGGEASSAQVDAGSSSSTPNIVVDEKEKEKEKTKTEEPETVTLTSKTREGENAARVDPPGDDQTNPNGVESVQASKQEEPSHTHEHIVPRSFASTATSAITTAAAVTAAAAAALGHVGTAASGGGGAAFPGYGHTSMQPPAFYGHPPHAGAHPFATGPLGLPPNPMRMGPTASWPRQLPTPIAQYPTQHNYNYLHPSGPAHVTPASLRSSMSVPVAQGPPPVVGHIPAAGILTSPTIAAAPGAAVAAAERDINSGGDGGRVRRASGSTYFERRVSGIAPQSGGGHVSGGQSNGAQSPQYSPHVQRRTRERRPGSYGGPSESQSPSSRRLSPISRGSDADGHTSGGFLRSFGSVSDLDLYQHPGWDDMQASVGRFHPYRHPRSKL